MWLLFFFVSEPVSVSESDIRVRNAHGFRRQATSFSNKKVTYNFGGPDSDSDTDTKFTTEITGDIKFDVYFLNLSDFSHLANVELLMTDTKSGKSTRKLIRNFFFVIFSGVLAAVAVAALSIHFLSPSGQYQAGAILMAPNTLQKISLTEQDPQTGKKTTFVFNRVELLHFDGGLKQWQRKKVALVLYEKFYSLVQKDVSLSAVPNDIPSVFNNGNPTMITLVAGETGPGERPERTRELQQVQIAPGEDYYRIRLRENGAQAEWVYFFHPDILRETVNLFAS